MVDAFSKQRERGRERERERERVCGDFLSPTGVFLSAGLEGGMRAEGCVYMHFVMVDWVFRKR